MAEQTEGDANMRRIIDRDASGRAVPKQVRVNPLAQALARAGDDAVIDPVVGQRQSVHGQPKRVACCACAAATQGHDARSMIRKISLEVRDQLVRPRFLDGFLCFRLGSRDLNPPYSALPDQGLAEDEACQVSQPQGASCECCDQKSVTITLEPPQWRPLIFGHGH